MKQIDPLAPGTSSQPRPRLGRAIDLVTGLVLFGATGLVVLWQNSRLAVLWDLSYTLENSYRISLGDVPYRDFPFAHAPLTFLIQAALIKLTGRVYWHHVIYCAVIGGLSTVITWRVLRNLLREISQFRLVAFVLSVPLIPLGVYSIFPHPFYDPDCTFFILIAILLLQQLERRPMSYAIPSLAGLSLVIPLFAKQNTGLAFIVAASVLLVFVVVVERWRKDRVRAHLLVLVGAALGIGFALSLIQYKAGIRNYWHWTIQFAAERRTPARGEMLGVYTDKMMLVWLALIAAGGIVLWLSSRVGGAPASCGRTADIPACEPQPSRIPVRTCAIVSALLISAPFIWPAIYLLLDGDPSERADRLLMVWPVVLICSFVLAVITIRRRRGISMVLPFLVIGAINGSFMSQQLWGSTYAIWPLLMILLAIMLCDLASLFPVRLAGERFLRSIREAQSWMIVPAATLIVLSLLIAGGFYIRSNERLSYANLDEGELKHSTLPTLKGLATRGDWLPNFEELAGYAEREIPRNEGILLLPGEDPFYYATGRRPQFPVLLFDHTVNPYSPEEILRLCRERNINWVIIKQDLQNEDEGVEQEKDRLIEAVEKEFEQVESLTNYDIYKRKDPNEKDDDDDSDSDSDSDSKQ
jgi:hypothetical protein